MPPENLYGVQATLTVQTTDESAAVTAATTAVSDINTALASLANGTSMSFAEIDQAITFDEDSGSSYTMEGQLLVGAAGTPDNGDHSALAAAAEAAIDSAISGITPAVAVVLQKQEGLGEHGYDFNLLQ